MNSGEHVKKGDNVVVSKGQLAGYKGVITGRRECYLARRQGTIEYIYSVKLDGYERTYEARKDYLIPTAPARN